MAEDVRSNRTNKPGRLARRVYEEAGGIRSAVVGPRGLIGRTGPQGGIHVSAIDNLLRSQYGPDYPMEVLDELVEAYRQEKNFQKRMGFSTRHERFIPRERVTGELGKEAHSGALEMERLARKEVVGLDRLIGEERRGEGKEGRKELGRRKRAHKSLEQINKEIADLTRRSEVTREGNLKKMVKQRRPTGKYSPLEVREFLGPGTGPESRERVTRRLRDLRNRRATILRELPFTGRGVQSEVTRYGKLANLARGIGKKGLKALGPLQWLAEPVTAIKTLREAWKGDEAELLKAIEYFQGLPEGMTGRGLTEQEKKEREQQNLPWYDPRRGEGYT